MRSRTLAHAHEEPATWTAPRERCARRRRRPGTCRSVLDLPRRGWPRCWPPAATSTAPRRTPPGPCGRSVFFGPTRAASSSPRWRSPGVTRTQNELLPRRWTRPTGRLSVSLSRRRPRGPLSRDRAVRCGSGGAEARRRARRAFMFTDIVSSTNLWRCWATRPGITSCAGTTRRCARCSPATAARKSTASATASSSPSAARTRRPLRHRDPAGARAPSGRARLRPPAAHRRPRGRGHPGGIRLPGPGRPRGRPHRRRRRSRRDSRQRCRWPPRSTARWSQTLAP